LIYTYDLGDEFVRIIVQNGGGEEVNTQNNQGRTPLHEVS